MKINCWEAKKCGREVGGNKVKELGICPVATLQKANGINNGINGGRCCWAIAGTFCGGKVQGTYSAKMINCMSCDFYKKVFAEEKKSPSYKTPAEILKILGDKR